MALFFNWPSVSLLGGALAAWHMPSSVFDTVFDVNYGLFLSYSLLKICEYFFKFIISLFKNCGLYVYKIK